VFDVAKSRLDALERKEKKGKPIKDVLTCGIGEDQSAVRKKQVFNSFFLSELKVFFCRRNFG
jgi:hypothetical protein